MAKDSYLLDTWGGKLSDQRQHCSRQHLEGRSIQDYNQNGVRVTHELGVGWASVIDEHDG